MQPKRLYWWLALAMLGILALSACAPRLGQGDTAAQAGADQLSIDLPALVIDFDTSGVPSVGGAPLATLAGAFGVAGLEAVALTPDQISTLTAANIQHLQVNNTPDGLNLLVNGAAIPTLVWDGESLGALQTLAENMGDGIPPIVQQLLPVLGRVGVGVTVRFPLAQGAELIPQEGAASGAAAAEAETARQAFLSSVGAPPTINIPVFYAPDGSWQVADMTDSEWIAVTGQSFWESLRLPEQMISDLTAAGVSEITVSTDADGIHLAINDQSLPHISWGEGRLANAIGLAAQTGLLGDADDAAGILSAVDALLPLVTGSQVQLHVFLPE